MTSRMPVLVPLPPPPRPPAVICAWCDKVMKDGTESASHTIYTICPACEAKYFPEADEKKICAICKGPWPGKCGCDKAAERGVSNVITGKKAPKTKNEAISRFLEDIDCPEMPLVEAIDQAIAVRFLTQAYRELGQDDRLDIHSNFRDETGTELPAGFPTSNRADKNFKLINPKPPAAGHEEKIARALYKAAIDQGGGVDEPSNGWPIVSLAAARKFLRGWLSGEED